MSAIDVDPTDLETVRKILRAHVPEMDVWAFGSRVCGTARPFSDLDIVLVGDKQLPIALLVELKQAFSASLLPFKVDVIDWVEIGDAFREIIRGEYAVLQHPRASSVRETPDQEA